jgi:hypothetical protein
MQIGVVFLRPAVILADTVSLLHEMSLMLGQGCSLHLTARLRITPQKIQKRERPVHARISAETENARR